MFQWDDRYNLRITAIDGQHQKLFRLASQLHAAMQAGNAEATPDILERVVQCGLLHFAYEERLMKEAGFPGFATHKAMHDKMTRQVLGLRDDLQASSRVVGLTVLQIFRKELIHHIETEDAKYVAYFKIRN